MTAVTARDANILTLRAAFPEGATVPVVVRRRSRGGSFVYVDVYDPTVSVRLTAEVSRVLPFSPHPSGHILCSSETGLVRALSRALYDGPDALSARAL